MENYITYAKTFNANKYVLHWIETTLSKYLAKHSAPTTQEIEHIIDYLIHTDKKIQRMSYADALLLADRWTVSQQKKGEHIRESESDVQTVLDFKDGFRIVKLIGEAAYKREGFLMSHCVGGYYGNGKEVFSLRDQANMPHCTIEKDQQIKGKGDGDIHPKYIDYVVQFLEYTGMKVRDSEMAHLGYEVAPFPKYVTTPLYRKRYVPKGKRIEYKQGVVIVETLNDLRIHLSDSVVLFKGNLSLHESLIAPKLTEVNGYVYAREGATLIAPKLTKSGSVYVSKGATFTAPKLTEVNGYVDVRDGTTFTAPKLTKSGSVDVYKGATFIAPKLTKSGSVYVRDGATFIAPKLTEVNGYVDVYKGATFTAPKLTEVSG